MRAATSGGELGEDQREGKETSPEPNTGRGWDLGILGGIPDSAPILQHLCAVPSSLCAFIPTSAKQ